MPKLKPYRQYSETDVINGLFSLKTVAPLDEPINAGTIVRISRNYKDKDGNISGFQDLAATVADGAISSLFTCVGQVEVVESSADIAKPIGITLKTVAEYDENGIPLKFEPRSAAERDFILPHQAVPILTRGIVLINGFDMNEKDPLGNNTGALVPPGDVSAGDAVYFGDNGSFGVDGIAGLSVGQFLSEIDSEGYALVKFNF